MIGLGEGDGEFFSELAGVGFRFFCEGHDAVGLEVGESGVSDMDFWEEVAGEFWQVFGS